MDLNDVFINIEEKNTAICDLEHVIVEHVIVEQTNKLYTKEQTNILYTKEQTNNLYNLNNTYIQIKNRIFNDLFVYLLPVLELEKIHQSHEK
jgi:hypothetical protein